MTDQPDVAIWLAVICGVSNTFQFGAEVFEKRGARSGLKFLPIAAIIGVVTTIIATPVIRYAIELLLYLDHTIKAWGVPL